MHKQDLHMEMAGKKSRIMFQGTFTIEVSLLMPLLIFLIWNLLYLAFFLYDQSTILQGCYCTALRTERMTGTEEEKSIAAMEKYQWSVRKKAVAAVLKENIKMEQGAVTVETEFSMKAPGGSYFQSIWKGKQTLKADAWEPVAFIRTCRKAENIGNIIQTGK